MSDSEKFGIQPVKKNLKGTRNDDLYYRGFSFPLYLIWSVFAALSYWAFRKSIDKVGWFGLIKIG